MGDNIQQIQDEETKARAFKALQDAARNKDSDPDTFEAARLRYNFLSKGPAWLRQEKQRITSEKLDPILAQYRDIYTSLANEEKTQSAYTDSIEAIRDKQSSLKSSAEKHASYFNTLMQTEEQKKSAFDRFVELTNPSISSESNEVAQEAPFIVKYLARFPPSFKIILDVILGLFIAIILFLAVSKARRIGSHSLFSRASSTGGINIFQSPAPSTFGTSGH